MSIHSKSPALEAESEAPSAVAAADAPPQKDSLLASPWLWAGVGAVIIGGVAAALVLSSGGETPLPIHGGADFPGSR
ncbi:MAG: hypothetical protein KA712_01395 [Myxococcales bacterium]|nr:hypothetical protein [Myxococcales bacterium]